MKVENILARPFSSWHLKPEPGEPSYGYFSRLVEDEGHSSTKIYATEIGLNGKHINPEELLNSLLTLGLDEASRNVLIQATPLRRGKLYHLGDDAVRVRQLSITKRRLCPACLAEDHTHKVWWDIQAFQNCPLHGLKLNGKSEAGEWLRWVKSGVTLTPRGEDLARTACRHSDACTRFEGFIIHRLRHDCGPEPELFVGRPLAEIIDAITFLSRIFQRRGGRNGGENIALSYAALSASRMHLVASIQQWLTENWTLEERKRGSKFVYGALNFVVPCERSDLVDDCIAAMREALAKTGRISRILRDQVSENRLELTLAEASRVLDISEDGLKNLVKHLGLGLDRYNLFFDPDMMDRLKDTIDQLVTATESEEISGLRAHEFSRLEKAGFINSITAVSRGQTRGRRYVASEVERLVAKVLPSAKAKTMSGQLPLRGYARRIGSRPSDVVIAVLEGRLQPVRADPLYQGFASLCFDVDVAPAGHEIAIKRRSDDMTFAEIAAQTGLQMQTISCLAKQGQLKLVPISKTKSMVRRRSFEAFDGKYANAQLYRSHLNCSPSNIRTALRARGIRTVFDPRDGRLGGTIVVRSEARAALGLDRDPDDIVATCPLWEAMKERLQTEGLPYAVQQTFTDGRAKIATTTSTVACYAEKRDDGGLSVKMHIHPKHSKRRFNLVMDRRAAIAEALPWLDWRHEEDGGVKFQIDVDNGTSIDNAIAFLKCMHRVSIRPNTR
ncbi:TniQ family protein [Rhizobium sp. C4]|uniref:TniQ family protein n=1 Tax=Rhizobium sp. C4 TaxID=1349800 RepID=UPI001E4838FC|nr:TniQ family protein [Rhizobium sp. C4]MCD2173963.1 TniQ family protein [Rhizobium sp. C4]